MKGEYFIYAQTVGFSAGVGRTGSLIAIDVELQRAQKEGVLDPFNFLHKLRDQRNHMVQTEVCIYLTMYERCMLYE